MVYVLIKYKREKNDDIAAWVSQSEKNAVEESVLVNHEFVSLTCLESNVFYHNALEDVHF